MAKRPYRRRFKRAVRLLFGVFFTALFLWWSNTSLQVTRFDPIFEDLPAGFDGCRIVVLGDLQSTEFGSGNERLLSAVAA